MRLQCPVAQVWRSLGGFSKVRKGSKDFSDEALRAAFNAIDLDGSGSVTEEELTKAIKEANPLATDKVIKEMIKFADSDGNGTIEFEEYKAIMMNGAE